MLCIFKGKKKIRDEQGNVVSQGRDAGMILKDIQAQVCDCEISPTVQHKKEGKNILVLKKETIAQATKRLKAVHTKNHLPFDPSTVVEDDLITSIESESIDPAPREVFISPNVKKGDGSPVTIDDFPDDMAFGNAVTANRRVDFDDGSSEYLTWVSIPDGITLTNAKREKLRSICED